MKKKFILEKSLTADAPEGYHYVRQNLKFTDTCQECGTETKVMVFSRCSEKNSDPKNMMTFYEFASKKVCSVECYRKTEEYRAANELRSHNDLVRARETKSAKC